MKDEETAQAFPLSTVAVFMLHGVASRRRGPLSTAPLIVDQGLFTIEPNDVEHRGRKVHSSRR